MKLNHTRPQAATRQPHCSPTCIIRSGWTRVLHNSDLTANALCIPADRINSRCSLLAWCAGHCQTSAHHTRPERTDQPLWHGSHTVVCSTVRTGCAPSVLRLARWDARWDGETSHKIPGTTQGAGTVAASKYKQHAWHHWRSTHWASTRSHTWYQLALASTPR